MSEQHEVPQAETEQPTRPLRGRDIEVMTDPGGVPMALADLLRRLGVDPAIGDLVAELRSHCEAMQQQIDQMKVDFQQQIDGLHPGEQPPAQPAAQQPTPQPAPRAAQPPAAPAFAVRPPHRPATPSRQR